MAFKNKEMFDDGTHNDGAAGDGVYGGVKSVIVVIQLIIIFMQIMIAQECFLL